MQNIDDASAQAAVSPRGERRQLFFPTSHSGRIAAVLERFTPPGGLPPGEAPNRENRNYLMGASVKG